MSIRSWTVEAFAPGAQLDEAEGVLRDREVPGHRRMGDDHAAQQIGVVLDLADDPEVRPVAGLSQHVDRVSHLQVVRVGERLVDDRLRVGQIPECLLGGVALEIELQHLIRGGGVESRCTGLARHPVDLDLGGLEGRDRLHPRNLADRLRGRRRNGVEPVRVLDLELALEAVVDRVGDRCLETGREDGDERNQGQPDHQGGSGRRGARRVPLGVLARQPAGQPAQPLEWRPDHRGERPDESWAVERDPEQHQRGATAEHQRGITGLLVAEQPDQHQGDSGDHQQPGDRDRDDRAAAARGELEVLHRCDRRHPSRAKGRVEHRDQGHCDADHDRDDHRPARDHERRGGQTDPERVEECLDALGEQQPTEDAEHGSDQPDQRRLHEHGGQHLSTGGTQCAQEPVLADPLRDGDREGVEDDECSDDQRHGREHAEEDRQEAERVMDLVGRAVRVLLRSLDSERRRDHPLDPGFELVR